MLASMREEPIFKEEASGKLPESLQKASRKLQESFKKASRKLQESFRKKMVLKGAP
ncbi:hypothetical protein [Paenibacillus sp. D51F]